jgi:CHAT domain-containing protein/Flp pilus assembly protein TadD
MLSALLLAAAAAWPPVDPVHAFVETLQSDRGVHAMPFAEPGAVVIAEVKSLSCIRVRTWHAWPEGDSIAVDVDAEGVTALGRRKALPAHWRLSHGTAQMLEESVAAQILSAKSELERQRLVESCTDCDRELLSIAASDITFDRVMQGGGTTPEMIEVNDFARRLAVDSGSVRAEVWALRVFGFIAGEPLGYAFGREAVALAESKGTCDDLAGARFTLGNILGYGGDRDEGARLLREAAALAERVDNPRIPLKALHNFSVLQNNRGKVASGMDAAARLAELATRYGWPEGEAAAWMDLGHAYVSVQRSDLAVAAFQHAANFFQADGNDEWAADALFQLSTAEEELGHYTRAITLMDRAIALDRNTAAVRRVVGLAGAAAMLARAGHLDRAESRLGEAQALVGTHLGVEGTEAAAEVRLAQRRLPEALSLAEQAIVSPTDMYGESIWRAQMTRGQVLLLLGRKNEAKQAFREAVKTIESRRAELPPDAAARQHYFVARAAPYHELLALLVAEGHEVEALAAAERLKARTLIDTLGARPAQESNETTRREQELMEQLAHLRQSLARTSTPAQRHRVEEAVARARNDLDIFRGDARWRTPTLCAGEDPPLSIGRIPTGAAVVEIVVAHGATTIFVVRDGRIRVRRVAISRAALARRANELTAAIESRRLDYPTFARRLAKVLVQPIEHWIEGARRIYVVPDDALWRVPFGVLPGRDGEPLLTRHEIAFAPSIRMIGPRPRSDGRRLVAFGNPAGFATAAPLFQTVKLPQTVTEVASIGHLYRSAAEVYSGARADEMTFKRRAPGADVIHVAAHAAVSADWPMESSLLLAGGGRDDGELEAQEILTLHLRCDVAVLAGCNTGGGQVGVGEGMLGLSWAFLAAGAHNAVVSQWNVDSRATERLMVAFHRALAAGATPPEALRQAALRLRRDPSFAHPFYWGSFVVIGSGR